MNVIIGLYVLVGKNKKIKYCINNFFRIFFNLPYIFYFYCYVYSLVQVLCKCTEKHLGPPQTSKMESFATAIFSNF